jgi:hypothetical protein
MTMPVGQVTHHTKQTTTVYNVRDKIRKQARDEMYRYGEVIKDGSKELKLSLIEKKLFLISKNGLTSWELMAV